MRKDAIKGGNPQDLEAFRKSLSEDPQFLEKLQRKAEMDEFKSKYNVEKSSPLRCPSCSQYGYSGGALWFNKDNLEVCVCRKCKLEWKLKCLSMSTDEAIEKTRAMIKGETETPEE